MSLISQLYIFPKQYSNKLFVYWNRRCWSTTQTKPPHLSLEWALATGMVFIQHTATPLELPHKPLHIRSLRAFHGDESPSSWGLPMLKTTHLTTMWFLCQAAWLAFRSTSPQKSWHLQVSRLDRHLSVAHAHLTRISTRCPIPQSNSSSYLQPLSAPHPALCLRPSLFACLFVWLFLRQSLSTQSRWPEKQYVDKASLTLCLPPECLDQRPMPGLCLPNCLSYW